MLKLKSILKPLALVVVLLAVFVAVLELPHLRTALLRYRVAARVFEVKGVKNGGGGTGFQIRAPSGISYIVTNAHVCESAMKTGQDKNYLLIQKDEFLMKRRILEISDRADLCLIEGWPGLSGLHLGSPSEVGDMVFAVGHPFLGPATMTAGEVTEFVNLVVPHHMLKTGNPQMDKSLQITDEPCNQPKNEIRKQILMLFGIIPMGEVPVCMVKETNAVNTNLTIHPGNSGSPMVDKWARVVGVVFATNDRTNWGLAVNLEHLQYFLTNY